MMKNITNNDYISMSPAETMPLGRCSRRKLIQMALGRRGRQLLLLVLCVWGINWLYGCEYSAFVSFQPIESSALLFVPRVSAVPTAVLAQSYGGRLNSVRPGLDSSFRHE